MDDPWKLDEPCDPREDIRRALAAAREGMSKPMEIDYDRRKVRLHPETIEAIKAMHGIDGTSLLGRPIIPDDTVRVGCLRWDYSGYAMGKETT